MSEPIFDETVKTCAECDYPYNCWGGHSYRCSKARERPAWADALLALYAEHGKRLHDVEVSAAGQRVYTAAEPALHRGVGGAAGHVFESPAGTVHVAHPKKKS